MKECKECKVNYIKECGGGLCRKCYNRRYRKLKYIKKNLVIKRREEKKKKLKKFLKRKTPPPKGNIIVVCPTCGERVMSHIKPQKYVKNSGEEIQKFRNIIKDLCETNHIIV